MKTITEKQDNIDIDSQPIGYIGFHYTADEISKYIESCGIFSLLFKCGKIIHFTPKDKVAFKDWLYSHKIENIKDK